MSTRYSAAEAISFSMSGELEGGEDQPTANRGQAPLSNRTEKPGRSILAGAPVVNSACRLTGEVSDLSRQCPVPIDLILSEQEKQAVSKTIQISEEDAAIVQEKVNLGLYPDTEAAIAEAIRLLDAHDELLALRAKIQVGIEQMERGEVIPFNDETRQRIIREGRAKYERGQPPNPEVVP